jgi:DNA repair protein RadA/Sms
MNFNFDECVEFGTDLREIEVPLALRRKVPSGLEYFDAIAGGSGFTPSSVSLFAGTPGAGKTTMLTMLANALGSQGVVSLFNTAEESIYQVKLNSERLKLTNPILTGQEVHSGTLIEKCEKIRNRPENEGKDFFLLIDSLQTLNDGKYGLHNYNSKTPVRCLEEIVEWCKKTYSIAVVVGQVGKDGTFSGSNMLKHMVDLMITLHIETRDAELYGTRVLTCEKNRFGSAGTQIWMVQHSDGFEEIARNGIGMDLRRE